MTNRGVRLRHEGMQEMCLRVYELHELQVDGFYSNRDPQYLNNYNCE